MKDDLFRVHELGNQGFCCSQILVIMGLEALNRENADLVRAMAGLCGGIEIGYKNCGALMGGMCLLSLYVGRGSLLEREVRFGNMMQQELLEWFDENFTQVYGGINCGQILENNPINKIQKCPQVVVEVYLKVKEILESYGHSINGLKED